MSLRYVALEEIPVKSRDYVSCGFKRILLVEVRPKTLQMDISISHFFHTFISLKEKSDRLPWNHVYQRTLDDRSQILKTWSTRVVNPWDTNRKKKVWKLFPHFDRPSVCVRGGISSNLHAITPKQQFMQ